MNKKEDALVVIRDRIAFVKDSVGLDTFIRNPSKPADSDDMPCIFMIEGVDNITDIVSRTAIPYPCRRTAEVVIELIVQSEEADGTPTDIKQKYRVVRKAIFTDHNTGKPSIHPLEDAPEGKHRVFIRENRTEGPLGYGLPDVLGMRLVLDLYYTDNG